MNKRDTKKNEATRSHPYDDANPVSKYLYW